MTCDVFIDSKLLIAALLVKKKVALEFDMIHFNQ